MCKQSLSSHLRAEGAPLPAAAADRRRRRQRHAVQHVHVVVARMRRVRAAPQVDGHHRVVGNTEVELDELRPWQIELRAPEVSARHRLLRAAAERVLLHRYHSVVITRSST